MQVYPTSGKLTIAGQPGAGLEVVLEPGPDYADRRHPPRGEVQSDGSFKIRTYATDDGAPAGTYSVRMSPSSSRPQEVSKELRQILANYAKSGQAVTVTVKAAGSNVLDPIDVKAN